MNAFAVLDKSRHREKGWLSRPWEALIYKNV